MGFANASVDTLLATRAALLRGLDRVAAALDDGTFHTVGHKGQAPPAQSGHLTLILLDEVNAELAQRGVKP